MDDFKQWLIFEGLFVAAAVSIWLFAAGKINTPFTQTDSFQEWKKKNGAVVRWMCILVVIVAVMIIAYKYMQIYNAENMPPSLPTD